MKTMNEELELTEIVSDLPAFEAALFLTSEGLVPDEVTKILVACGHRSREAERATALARHQSQQILALLMG